MTIALGAPPAIPPKSLPVEGVMVFADRADAGRRLAARLEHLRGEPVVVLGLRARLLRLSADD